jgi:hypothetical protein
MGLRGETPDQRQFIFSAADGDGPRATRRIAHDKSRYAGTSSAEFSGGIRGNDPFGNYHETPPWEVSVSGPYDRWPTSSGFDKFYGFIGGETNQWAPMTLG